MRKTRPSSARQRSDGALFETIHELLLKRYGTMTLSEMERFLTEDGLGAAFQAVSHLIAEMNPLGRGQARWGAS